MSRPSMAARAGRLVRGDAPVDRLAPRDAHGGRAVAFLSASLSFLAAGLAIEVARTAEVGICPRGAAAPTESAITTTEGGRVEAARDPDIGDVVAVHVLRDAA